MSGDGAGCGQAEGRAGGSHALEFAIFAASVVDGFIGREDCVVQGIFRGVAGVFEEGDGKCIDADPTGQITHGMTTDAISHDEEVSEPSPFVVIGAKTCGEGILVHGAAHSHVGARCILHNGGSGHRGYSGDAGEVGSREGAFREAAEDSSQKTQQGGEVPDRERAECTLKTLGLASEQGGNQGGEISEPKEWGPAGPVNRPRSCSPDTAEPFSA